MCLIKSLDVIFSSETQNQQKYVEAAAYYKPDRLKKNERKEKTFWSL